ncbi:TetR family transcriptional regulator [Skermanella stibiiresistens SB22]|uniref:TetR family transcriptional regulator n=1 Tax=Skermanella stibiiresistens SB22 TaxID=1385369 RepID=W9H4E9_9PROT|nr:TetR/AcrR family transcriptional regulator [Skermanella stibiiresistens]EWY39597.1 TetR family transcriptional regulator [Skermanella stibiiresistens SB22]
MSGAETKEIILDTAERLFAERSFASVSLREITAAAGVNLAAVNYHFGSKDALLLAVFRRRATDLNRERITLLKEAEARAGDHPVPLREILAALLSPPIRWTRQRTSGLSVFIQFMARVRTDGTPEMRKLMDKDVGHIHRFVVPTFRTLPHLPKDEIYWRLHFTLALMHYTITDLGRLEAISGGLCDLDDTDALIERMIDFAVAGFGQPVQGGAALEVLEAVSG